MSEQYSYTFLFTDIEGSTRLWERHPDEMRIALEQHDTILGTAINKFDGEVFKTVGDAFCAMFASPASAILCALQIQETITNTLFSENISSLAVRMGIHTGEAEARDGDYFGPALNQVARIESAAHGGQVLVSREVVDRLATEVTEQIELLDLGQHILKDLIQPHHLYQISTRGQSREFPPINSLNASLSKLPAPTTKFVGREREISDLTALLADQHVRLVTLTGPGGHRENTVIFTGGRGPGRPLPPRGAFP